MLFPLSVVLCVLAIGFVSITLYNLPTPVSARTLVNLDEASMPTPDARKKLQDLLKGSDGSISQRQVDAIYYVIREEGRRNAVEHILGESAKSEATAPAK